MVDWVLEAARPLGPEPLVVVASPDTAAAFDGVDGRRPGAAARDRGCGPLAHGALDRRGRVLVLSGDTPLLTTELLEELLAAHRARGRRRPCSRSSPTTCSRYGRIVRDTAGDLVAIVEAADATASSSRSARRTRPSTSSTRRAVAAVERLEPENAQGELYLTDAVRDIVDGAARRGARRRRPGRDRGRQHARGARGRRRGSARPDQPGAHAGRSDDRRPVVDLDRADGQLEPDAVDPSVHRPPRRDVASPPAPRSGPHVVAIDATIGQGRSSDRSVTFAPEPCSGLGKAGTFVELKNPGSARAPRCPPLVHRGRGHRRGHEHRCRRDHRQPVA